MPLETTFDLNQLQGIFVGQKLEMSQAAPHTLCRALTVAERLRLAHVVQEGRNSYEFQQLLAADTSQLAADTSR